MIVTIPGYWKPVKYSLDPWDRKKNPYLRDFLACVQNPENELHKLPFHTRKRAWRTGDKKVDHFSACRLFRDHYTQKYAWSIPDHRALTAIKEVSPDGVMDIGCGTGYWAYLMKKMGMNVVAYDNHLRKKMRHGFWHKYHRAGLNTALRRESHRRTLFLSWPEYGSPMAYHCLRGYRGEVFAYVGEGPGGCTGDDRFHELLEERWEEEEEVGIPQWEYVHDTLTIYRRKK